MSVVRRFGFRNLRLTLSDEQLAAAHASMAAVGLHAYGTCENNHRDATKHTPPGYKTLQGPRGYRANTAIHFKPSALRLLRWNVSLLHLSNLFPSANRAFAWARFRDLKTGRRLTFVVVHLVPHADDPDDPGDVNDTPRGELVHRSLRILAGFARTVLGQLVVVGDFNIDLRADLRHHDHDGLAETFRRAGLETVPVLTGRTVFATHGHPDHGPAYDQAWIKWPARRWRRTLRPRSFERLPRRGDHFGLSFSADSTVRRTWRTS